MRGMTPTPSDTFHVTDATPARRRRWLGPALAVAALLAITIGGYLVWRQFNPAALTITGTVEISDESLTFDGQRCRGDGGFSDMREGTQVTVTSSGGDIIALGSLQTGTARGYGTCIWRFTVDDVPTGQGFYGIEVSQRGVLRFAEADLTRPITLGVGSGG